MFLVLHSIRLLQPPASYISVIAPEEWRLQRSRSNLWGFGFHFAEVEMELQPFPLANLTRSSCTRYLGEHPQKNLWGDPSPGRRSTVAWPLHLVDAGRAWASAAICWQAHKNQQREKLQKIFFSSDFSIDKKLIRSDQFKILNLQLIRIKLKAERVIIQKIQTKLFNKIMKKHTC